MASGYPTTIDNFGDPGPTTYEDATGFEHDVIESNQNRAINNIETYVGATGSAVPSSLTYKLNNTTLHRTGDESASGEKTFSGDVLFGSGRPWVDVGAYGAAGDGTTDDTTAIQSAITACPTNGTIYFPLGTYKISSTLTITGTKSIQGAGSENGSKLVATAAVTGPVLSVSPSSFAHHLNIRGIGIDVTLASAANGLYLNNFDSFIIQDVHIRGGTVGFDFANVQIGVVRDCYAYNQSTAGFKLNHASCGGWGFDNCLAYQTSGATGDMTQGWLVSNAYDIQWHGCRALRTPGTANKMLYGIKISLTGGAFGGFMMTNTECDAMTDLTVDGTGAAVYLENASKVQISNCWLSAYPAADLVGGTVARQPALTVKGGADVFVANTWFSGGGIRLRSSPTDVVITGGRIVNATNVFDVLATEGPTSMRWSGLSVQSGTTLTNDADVLLAGLAEVESGPVKLTSSAVAVANGLRIFNPKTGKYRRIKMDDSGSGTLAILNSSDSQQYSLSDGGLIQTQGGITIGPSASNTQIKAHKHATVSYAGTTLAGDTRTTVTVPVSGAVLGDQTTWGYDQTLPTDVIVTSYVSSSGNISVRFANLHPTNNAVLPSGTLSAATFNH